jgi:hypothetical protein
MRRLGMDGSPAGKGLHYLGAGAAGRSTTRADPVRRHVAGIIWRTAAWATVRAEGAVYPGAGH